MKLKKPLLVYDGDCRFCRQCLRFAKKRTKNKVEYQPYQKVASQFKKIPLSEFKRSVQLIEPEGKVYTGAEAVYRTMAYGGGFLWKISVWKYKHVPGFAPISEWVYRRTSKKRQCL